MHEKKQTPIDGEKPPHPRVLLNEHPIKIPSASTTFDSIASICLVHYSNLTCKRGPSNCKGEKENGMLLRIRPTTKEESLQSLLLELVNDLPNEVLCLQERKSVR